MSQNKSQDPQGLAGRVYGENTTLTPRSSKSSIVNFENRDPEAEPNPYGISERQGSSGNPRQPIFRSGQGSGIAGVIDSEVPQKFVSPNS
jgi:hypothetical protein